MIETTYTPTSRPRGFAFTGFSVRAYRDLLVGLVEAQIKVRFHRSFVGLGWFILNPLLFMLLYAFVFGAVFSQERADYKLFLLAGLFPWQAMTAGVAASLRSLIMGVDLMKKASFPSEILPISTALASIVNLAVVMTVYVVYLAVRGFPVLSQIHWVVAAMIVQTILLVGLALILGSLNLFFRDVEQAVGFLIWIWFFLTPILFPLSRVYGANAELILFVNPMAPIVSTYQKALLIGEAPPAKPLLASLMIAVSLVIAGFWMVRRWHYEFAKEA